MTPGRTLDVREADRREETSSPDGERTLRRDVPLHGARQLIAATAAMINPETASEHGYVHRLRVFDHQVAPELIGQ